MNTRPKRWLVIPIALAAVLTVGSIMLAGNGNGHGPKDPARCPKCSDPCDSTQTANVICLDRSTGESFESAFACCCCVDEGKQRSFYGPK